MGESLQFEGIKRPLINAIWVVRRHLENSSPFVHILPLKVKKYLLRVLGSQIGSRSGKAHSQGGLEWGPNRSSRPLGDKNKYTPVHRGGKGISRSTHYECRLIFLDSHQNSKNIHLSGDPSTYHPLFHQTSGVKEVKSCQGEKSHHWWRVGETIQLRVHHRNKLPHLDGWPSSCTKR